MKAVIDFVYSGTVANHLVHSVEKEAEDQSTTCNYADDYYGDRRCKSSKPAK